MDYNLFVNSTFKVLELIFDNRNAYGITHLTQTEMADLLGLSRITVNNKVRVLKEHGYVIKKYKNSTEYELTDAGLKTVKYMRRIY